MKIINLFLFVILFTSLLISNAQAENDENNENNENDENDENVHLSITLQ